MKDQSFLFNILLGYLYRSWIVDRFLISVFVHLAAFVLSSVWTYLVSLGGWILGAPLARGEQQMWVSISLFQPIDDTWIASYTHELTNFFCQCAEGVHPTLCWWWPHWGCWLPWCLAWTGTAGSKWSWHSHCTGTNCLCYLPTSGHGLKNRLKTGRFSQKSKKPIRTGFTGF
jgi:hypothetical protein